MGLAPIRYGAHPDGVHGGKKNEQKAHEKSITTSFLDPNYPPVSPDPKAQFPFITLRAWREHHQPPTDAHNQRTQQQHHSRVQLSGRTFARACGSDCVKSVWKNFGAYSHPHHITLVGSLVQQQQRGCVVASSSSSSNCYLFCSHTLEDVSGSELG